MNAFEKISVKDWKLGTIDSLLNNLIVCIVSDVVIAHWKYF